MKYKKLFSPVKVGSITLKNRFAMAPMGPLGLADANGGWNQRGIDYYVERAKGGTGLIITGVTFFDQVVEKQDPSTVPNPLYKPVNFVKTSREMTERVHAYGSKIFLQLSGGFGRVTIPTNVGDIPPIAPSPIPHRWLDKICREISVDEIHAIVRQFGEAAFHAKRAGFDGVQIHAVHEGYLMDQFAISMFNQRTDEYGGSPENCARFPVEIVQAIKSVVGDSMPVIFRISLDHRFPGGRTMEDSMKLLKILEAAGVDAFDVDAGCYETLDYIFPPSYLGESCMSYVCAEARKTVNVPLFTAGTLAPDSALELIVLN